MNYLKSILAALAATSFAGLAQAQDSGNTDRSEEDSGAYGAIGGVIYNTELYGAEAKLGYNFNKYFGVEAQGSFGVNTDSDRLFDSPTSASITTKIDYSIGAFGVARLPLNEKLDVFARAGIHNTQVSESINNALMSNFDRTETGFAVGGGAQFNFDKKNGVRAEYTYFDKLNGGAVSVGYVRKF